MYRWGFERNEALTKKSGLLLFNFIKAFRNHLLHFCAPQEEIERDKWGLVGVLQLIIIPLIPPDISVQVIQQIFSYITSLS